jgi:hypothetical protein
MIVKGIRELARELGMSVGLVHKHLASGTLPAKGPAGYDVEAARRALDAKAEGAAAAIANMASPANPSSQKYCDMPGCDEAVDLATKYCSTHKGSIYAIRERFDPLAIAEKNVRRAQELVETAGAVELPRVIDGVNKALLEHRRTHAGELAIAKTEGKVISVDDARATIGKVSRTFVTVLERLEAKLASQVELWVFDQELRALEPPARRRAVQEWFAAQSEVVRRLTAAEIERMIAEEVAGDE